MREFNRTRRYRQATQQRRSGSSAYNTTGNPAKLRVAGANRYTPLNKQTQVNNRYKTTAKKRKPRKKGSAVKGAESRLKNFRQATILAVAITGFILTLFSAEDLEVAAQDTPLQEQVMEDTVPETEQTLADTAAAEVDSPASSKESADEALGALHNLWNNFYFNLPKLLIAIGILILAWLFTRLLRFTLQRVIGRWSRSNAITTLILISVWILAVGIAVSVVAGDIRALVGSFGLIGLALSWSLQTPIESFTGWLLNSFQGYYRVGDRVRVGEVFGDVFRIDFLTTTVWEIGAPYQPGFVQAEQPTGRLVTFPNNEILTGTVINLTGDFPYVWDELSVAIANESDMPLAMEVLERVAQDLLGDYMVEPARLYSHQLKKAGLDSFIKDKPQVFISIEDSWTNVTIRYLVGARERRKWKSELSLRTIQELSKPEYKDKLVSVYPRQQVQFIDPEGRPEKSDKNKYKNNKDS